MEKNSGLVGVIAGERNKEWLEGALEGRQTRFIDASGTLITAALQDLKRIAALTVIVDDDLLAEDENAAEALCAWAKGQTSPHQRIIIFSNSSRDEDDPFFYRLVSDCDVRDIMLAQTYGEPDLSLVQLIDEPMAPMEYERWKTLDPRMWEPKQPGLLGSLFGGGKKDKKADKKGKDKPKKEKPKKEKGKKGLGKKGSQEEPAEDAEDMPEELPAPRSKRGNKKGSLPKKPKGQAGGEGAEQGEGTGSDAHAEAASQGEGLYDGLAKEEKGGRSEGGDRADGAGLGHVLGEEADARRSPQGSDRADEGAAAASGGAARGGGAVSSGADEEGVAAAGSLYGLDDDEDDAASEETPAEGRESEPDCMAALSELLDMLPELSGAKDGKGEDGAAAAEASPAIGLVRNADGSLLGAMAAPAAQAAAQGSGPMPAVGAMQTTGMPALSPSESGKMMAISAVAAKAEEAAMNHQPTTLDLSDEATVAGLWDYARELMAEIDGKHARLFAQTTAAPNGAGDGIVITFPICAGFPYNMARKGGSVADTTADEALRLAAEGTVPHAYAMEGKDEPGEKAEPPAEADQKADDGASGEKDAVESAAADAAEEAGRAPEEAEEPGSGGAPVADPKAALEGGLEQAAEKASAAIEKAEEREPMGGEQEEHGAEGANGRPEGKEGKEEPMAEDKETEKEAQAGGGAPVADPKAALEDGLEQAAEKAGAKLEKAEHREPQRKRNGKKDNGHKKAEETAAETMEISIPVLNGPDPVEAAALNLSDLIVLRSQSLSLPSAPGVCAIASIRPGIGCTHTAVACGVAAAALGAASCVALRTRASLNSLRDMLEDSTSINGGLGVRWRGCDFYAWEDQRRFSQDYEVCFADCGVLDTRDTGKNSPANLFMNHSKVKCLLTSGAPWDLQLILRLLPSIERRELGTWTIGMHSMDEETEAIVSTVIGQAAYTDTWRPWRQPFTPNLYMDAKNGPVRGIAAYTELMAPALPDGMRTRAKETAQRIEADARKAASLDRKIKKQQEKARRKAEEAKKKAAEGPAAEGEEGAEAAGEE